MSERATMKRRVRGLIRKNWLQPLAALLLAWLPVLAASALLFFLMRPAATENSGTSFQFVFTPDDLKGMAIQLIFLLQSPKTLFAPLMGWLPLVCALAALHLLVTMPINVSVSSYFLNYLRGKQPKVTDVYGSFSGKYPRAFGGMAYKFLWQCLWFLLAFGVPTVAVFCGAPLVSSLGVELNTQIYIFAAMLVIGIIWYIVFLFIFIARMLAYSLTPICIAAQPRLASHRAVRLSRKLMRGCKWRVIGLFLSFLNYFIPAIIAAILLPLLHFFGASIGIAEGLQGTIRLILLIIIIVNQLAWLYVAPYLVAGINAFYIERKREALMDEELTQADFASLGKPGKNMDNTDSKPFGDDTQ